MLESTIMQHVAKHSAATIKAITALHHRWLRDSEIAERLGLETLEVWHLRQHHNINRHLDRPSFLRLATDAMPPR